MGLILKERIRELGLYGERSHRCEFAMGEFAIGIGIEKKILFDWHKDHGGKTMVARVERAGVREASRGESGQIPTL